MALRTGAALFRRAREVIPGGVNSPVRAWKAVGGEEPFFARRGEGAWLEDAEGNRYVDWVMSWGPLLLGHAEPDVIAAARARFDAPVWAYNVSGEYAMVKAAAARGWLDERRAAVEGLTAIKRAGADFVVSYWTKELAGWL